MYSYEDNSMTNVQSTNSRKGLFNMTLTRWFVARGDDDDDDDDGDHDDYDDAQCTCDDHDDDADVVQLGGGGDEDQRLELGKLMGLDHRHLSITASGKRHCDKNGESDEMAHVNLHIGSSPSNKMQ